MFTYYQQNQFTRVRFGRAFVVRDGQTGLLYRHGSLDTVLQPGPHRRFGAGFELRVIDTRPSILTVPTQEVPTSDGVTVKLTVALSATVSDPVIYVSSTQDALGALYLSVQIALREVVSALSLEDLLADRVGLTTKVAAATRGLDDLGVTAERFEVKDIILPNELKRAQAEVLIAKAEALAQLERARGETAALRSLANAAKTAADNPAVMQLRLIQELGSGNHTLVMGAGGTPVLPS